MTLARHQGLGVGLWIARRHLTLSIVDFSKSIIAEHTLPLPLGHKADTTLERAMLLINETLSSIDAEAASWSASAWPWPHRWPPATTP